MSATASAYNHDFVRGLGANEVIDYRTTRFEQATRPVDIVLDGIGGEVLARSLSMLKPGGFLASILDPVEPATVPAGLRGIRRAKGMAPHGKAPLLPAQPRQGRLPADKR